jgi:glycosyltransferase involved in cell wall biosynthesis
LKKQLIFMHQNYPAQFGPITRFLLQEYDVNIAFFSQYTAKNPVPGIRHYTYKPVSTGHEQKPYFFSRYFEMECTAMHGVHNAVVTSGLQPDLFIGHVAFGNMGLLHVEYPEVPKIGFFELFYDPYGRYSESRPEYPAPKPNRLRVPLRNATQLIELEYCTKGYSPTGFQRSTYPEAYQSKLSVFFDGIDTHQYKPGDVAANSQLPRTWPADARLVTYVARGLEAMRGFDIFMEVAHRVSQKRPDVHFVIAGNPKTHYGSEMLQIKEETFKDYVMKLHPYDLNRFHFLNWIPEPALVDLFRLSDCHFYWTVPFTLSWSLFQAMSTGCLVLGSNSAPVREAITDGVNGVLLEPYNIDALEAGMLDMLDYPERYQPLREAARQDMVEKYGFEVCLPNLAEFYLATGSPAAPAIDSTPTHGLSVPANIPYSL